MKKILLLIIIPLLVFGAMYLGGCFANVSFDISKWGEFSRCQVAYWGIAFGFASIFLVHYNVD
jgi:hypothetical protein